MRPAEHDRQDGGECEDEVAEAECGANREAEAGAELEEIHGCAAEAPRLRGHPLAPRLVGRRHELQTQLRDDGQRLEPLAETALVAADRDELVPRRLLRRRVCGRALGRPFAQAHAL